MYESDVHNKYPFSYNNQESPSSPRAITLPSGWGTLSMDVPPIVVSNVVSSAMTVSITGSKPDNPITADAKPIPLNFRYE